MTPSLSERTLQQLKIIARTLLDDPSYMAWVIKIYLVQEKLSGRNLADILGVSEESLVRLALCKRPHLNTRDFSNQIRKISQYTSIDIYALARLIRQFESITSLATMKFIPKEKKASSYQLGFATARDRTKEENEEDHKDEGDVA